MANTKEKFMEICVWKPRAYEILIEEAKATLVCPMDAWEKRLKRKLRRCITVDATRFCMFPKPLLSF